MKPEQFPRAILPDVLIDNFDNVSVNKSADRFDIYLDEKKVQLKKDKYNPEITVHGFGDYRVIQDYPILAPPISISVSVNDLINRPTKSSATTGTYQNLTAHGSIQSLCLLKKRRLSPLLQASVYLQNVTE